MDNGLVPYLGGSRVHQRCVLILVVVDNGLVRIFYFICNSNSSNVLILVVVDNGLVHQHQIGIWSSGTVLILVVVDNGLVLVYLFTPKINYKWVLILVVVDNGLVRVNAETGARTVVMS